MCHCDWGWVSGLLRLCRQDFSDPLQPWLDALPKEQTVKLIATAPHEAFFTYMKVAFIAGVMLAVPVILYQLWCLSPQGSMKRRSAQSFR